MRCYYAFFSNALRGKAGEVDIDPSSPQIKEEEDRYKISYTLSRKDGRGKNRVWKSIRNV